MFLAEVLKKQPKNKIEGEKKWTEFVLKEDFNRIKRNHSLGEKINEDY